MHCLDSIFQVWWDKGFVQGEKNTGGKGLSLVFKTIPRSLVVETVGRVWVLGGLEDGRV